jgi:cyclic pyranopterin phosphate synthase
MTTEFWRIALSPGIIAARQPVDNYRLQQYCLSELQFLVFQPVSRGMPPLTHFDESGASRMVDVGAKPITERMARAAGRVTMAAATLRTILDGGLTKGDVIEVARLAGIMAAKKTPELIPLCHSLGLDSVTVDLRAENESTLWIESTVRVQARTGVEMEALTAVAVAALTVYDMCKSLDRELTIGPFLLLEKSGGQSGHFVRGTPPG